MKNLTFEQLPDAVSQLDDKLEEIKELFLQRNQSSNSDGDQLFTIEECAAFLRLSKSTVYKHSQNGKLPVMKRFEQNYFLKSELIEYLKASRKKTVAEIENETEERLIKSRRK